jgi:hypothetical protein
MELEGSLPCSEHPAIGPYPEPDASQRNHAKLKYLSLYLSTSSRSRNSSVIIALCGSRQGLGIFPFTTASRPALGPTQLPIQWVPGTLSLGVKLSGRETEHSPPYSDEVKNAWSYTSTLQYAFMVWCSVKAQRQLYLYLSTSLRCKGCVEVNLFSFIMSRERFPYTYSIRGWVDMIHLDALAMRRVPASPSGIEPSLSVWIVVVGPLNTVINLRIP